MGKRFKQRRPNWANSSPAAEVLADFVLAYGFPRPGNLRLIFKRAQNHPQKQIILEMMEKAGLTPIDDSPFLKFRNVIRFMLDEGYNPTNFMLFRYYERQFFYQSHSEANRFNQQEMLWMKEILLSKGWKVKRKKKWCRWIPPENWIERGVIQQ